MTTSPLLLSRIQATCKGVTLPSTIPQATLVAWLKRPGDAVARGEGLATITTQRRTLTIASTISGRIKVLMLRPESPITSDMVLCYVQPRDPVEETPPDPPASTRRPSILPDIEELVFERTPSPAPNRPSTADKHPPAAKEPRTQAKVYRMTPDQVRRVKELTHRLDTHAERPAGAPFTESELVRAAIEYIFALSETEMLQLVAENRRREQAGRYGTGWPRPSVPATPPAPPLGNV